MWFSLRFQVTILLVMALCFAIAASRGMALDNRDPMEPCRGSRDEISSIIELSHHHWSQQNRIEAYKLALRARRLDSAAAHPSGASRIIAEYQAYLLAHEPSEYIAMIRSKRLPRLDRHELVGLLEVFTGLSAEWQQAIDDDTEAQIAQLVAQRNELEHALGRNRDRQTQEAILELYADQADIYRLNGRPDLALNTLMEGHQREVEFGMAGGETSVLDFTLGSFFQELWAMGDEIMLVLSSRDVSVKLKRQIISNLHDAISRDDFRE